MFISLLRMRPCSSWQPVWKFFQRDVVTQTFDWRMIQYPLIGGGCLFQWSVQFLEWKHQELGICLAGSVGRLNPGDQRPDIALITLTSSCFFLYGWLIFHTHIKIFSASFDGHLGWLDHLAIVNNATFQSLGFLACEVSNTLSIPAKINAIVESSSRPLKERE